MGDSKAQVDRPLWTLFFEGTLYKRYQEYLKNHDLTKILDSKPSTLSQTSSTSIPPVLDDDTNWLPDIKNKDVANGTTEPNASQYSPPPRQNKFLTEVEKKRRKRRTTGCVVLGVLGMGAIAAAAALVIHFVFIKTKEAKVSDSTPIKIPGRDFHHNITGLLFNETFTRTVLVTTPKPTSKKMDTGLKLPGIDKPDDTKKPLGDKEDKKDQIAMAEPTTTIATTKKPSTEAQPPKLAEMIHLNYEQLQDDVDVNGEEGGVFTCEIVDIPEWTSVFIHGDKTRKESNETFKFVLKPDGEWTLKGNNSHQTVTHQINKMGALTTIVLTIKHTPLSCSDQDRFSCGVKKDDKVESKSANVVYKGHPSPNVTLVIPVQVIEDKVLSISASWKAGYPHPSGNISWHQQGLNETEKSNLSNAEMSWTLKTNHNKCETIIDSFAKFTTDLQFNGTEVTAQVDMREPIRNIAPASEIVYVVPKIYCDEFTNDTTTSHPYTCEKFVRCMPERMLIYACPKNTCFNADSKQCD